jgi:hypothetical protein
LPSSVTHSPDRTRPGTPFLTSAIPGLRSALECRNLISSNSFAHRLGTGNSALRLAPGPVGLKPELRQGRSDRRTQQAKLYIRLVGTRDGRTQSAHACKPALLHLALRTLGFKTSVFGSEDLGFRTSINGHWVSLSRSGFQDLDKRALGFTLMTWVSGPRKLSILRLSYLFPVTFLCVHRHFSPASSFPVTFLCVQWSQTSEPVPP